MVITIAICTWNRANLLDQTLAGMHKVRSAAGVEWELLIVNNGSNDKTDEVIVRHASQLPIRRLFEPEPGLSKARNLAVRHARGTYILWTDDDVLVDQDWILEYCNAFNRWPDAAVFGGPIRPWFAGTPPRWLQEVWSRVAQAYAIRDLGDEPVAFTQDLVPFGANFAVRTKDQSGYLYDPGLGRKRERMLGGDETRLIRTMLSEGASGWWVPKAGVRHLIPRNRQTTRYLRRYFFGYGQYLARAAPDGGVRKLFGKPRWVWRHAIEAELNYHLGRLFRRPEWWIEHLKRASICWGRLYG